MQRFLLLVNVLLLLNLNSEALQIEHTSNPIIDSLFVVLKHHSSNKGSKEDIAAENTIRLSTLNKLSWEYINTGDYDKAMQHAEEVIDIVEKLSGYFENDGGSFIAVAYHNIGTAHYSQGSYDKAIEYFIKSIKIKGENENKEGMASTYNNIGVIYYVQGNYDKAIEYYIKSLKIYEEIGKKSGMASSYNNIGLIHKEQGNFTKAIEYYIVALKIEEEFGNRTGVAYSYNNIGEIHDNIKEYDKAIDYYIKGLKIFEETGNKKGMAVSFNNIGFIYTKLYKNDTLVKSAIQKEGYTLPSYALLDSARHYNLKGYALSREIGDKNTMISSLAGLGNILNLKKSYKDALHFYEQAAALADSIGANKELYNAYKGLSEIHYKLGNGTKAYEYLNKSITLRDTVQSEEAKENMVRMEMQHEYEKKFAADSVKVAEEKKVVAAQLESEKAQRYGLYGGLALMFTLAGVSYRSYRSKRKAHAVIEKQKYLVEEKQKEILDSINYAKRIQAAVLPSERIVKEYLPDSFILYKPKDIVAGDFYWMESYAKASDSKGKNVILFAAADCTGHGVPGAMVSVICNNGLNRSVREHGLTEPGEILDKTREIIIGEFEKSDEEVKDGMDISLCALSYSPSPLGEGRSGVILKWSGANNPLLIIRNNEIIEYKPNKQPIGKYAENKPFTTHTIEMLKGDTIYLFTDGYADQFGGEKGKKFKYAKLKELLLSINTRPMSEQKNILEESFETWKGNLEQVDDVCIIGVRV